MGKAHSRFGRGGTYGSSPEDISGQFIQRHRYSTVQYLKNASWNTYLLSFRRIWGKEDGMYRLRETAQDRHEELPTDSSDVVQSCEAAHQHAVMRRSGDGVSFLFPLHFYTLM